MDRIRESDTWRLLLVDDDEGDYFIVREMLAHARREKYRLEWVSSYAAGLEKLASGGPYDAILVDYDLGPATGIELIQRAVTMGVQSPIVMLTGRGSYDVDMEAMAAGADDYLSKQDINPALLEHALRYAIERKQAQNALRRQQEALRSQDERFRLAARAVTGIVYEWNVITGEITRSEGLQRVTGYPLDHTTAGFGWWEALIHPDDRARIQKQLQEMLTGNHETYEAEYRVRHRDGHWVHLWDRSFLERDAQGRLLRVIGVSSDITQRKQLELALAEANHELARANAGLRDSEGRFRVALAGAPITVFSQDLDLRYTWFFRSQADHGSDLRHVIGRRDDELFDAAEARAVMALKRRVIDTGKKEQHEVSLRIGGRPYAYLIVMEPDVDPEGVIRGLVGSALDITDVRRLEAWRLEHVTQTEVQHRLLEQREMERLQIARDLHDGPIQDLVLLVYDIQSAAAQTADAETHEALRSMLQKARDLTSALRGVCNDLRPPALVQFGLSRAIRLHAEDFRQRGTGIQVELDLTGEDEDIPETLQLALFRIYQEGLNNVNKHARASRLGVRLKRVEGQVTLEMEDNGCGFAPPRDWLSLAREGHLGLVGMKERCDAVGGQFEVVSGPGQGTKISVTAPVSITPPPPPV